MTDKSMRLVIILGTLAIMGIIAVQSYWIMNTWDLQSEQFDRSARIALRKAAEELAALDSLHLPDKDLIVRRSSNYYVVNFNNVIDGNNLEFYLQKNIEKHLHVANFEYGIFDCSSDEMVFGDVCILEEGGETPTGVNLPKYDEFTYYFGVRFLGRDAIIVNKMQLSILFTIILFLAIAFFVYSIFVMLRQKRFTELQKDFINNMTHEFKTPISTIKISAEVFLKDEKIKNDPRLSRYATIIKEQNQRLNNQVEKVLQVASLDKDNFKLKKESIDLNELLEDIIDNSKLKIEEEKGTISSELSEKKSIILADRLHLTNIIYNMLDNSIKYCQDKPEIQVSTKNEKKCTHLIISDKGMGMSKDNIVKAFDKFYRVNTGDVHNVKGFGLGLFYVKNIIESHGWKIKLDSKVDQGTTITVIIPQG
ncbi:MAG: sensor histidine kinase [Saprospiraceae bacterium]